MSMAVIMMTAHTVIIAAAAIDGDLPDTAIAAAHRPPERTDCLEDALWTDKLTAAGEAPNTAGARGGEAVPRGCSGCRGDCKRQR